MYATFRFFAIMLIFTLMAGFFIVPTRSMPDNAIVFLDDANRTYLSPGCARQEEKSYRQARAAETQQLKYEPDKRCGGAAGFSQDARSLSGRFMERLGMLPPLPSRWNPDGTWNW
ncbi:MAG: hypothetical protein ACHQX0_03915 [Desulfobaccales bacterium]